MRYLDKTIVGVCLFFVAIGCGNAESVKTNTNEIAKPKPTIKQNKDNPKSKLKTDVDVVRLANKSASVFDETFGEPVKTKPIKNNPKFMPGEYREYAIKGHPKNLSVRFYKDKAKRFNLLLGKGEKSSKKALKDIFKIDVNKLRPAKSDGLSQTWKGKVDKVTFKTAYAKRNKSGGNFVMLHAEIR